MGDCVVSEASLGKRIARWAERLIDGEKVLLFCARKKEASQPLVNGRAPSAAFVLVDQAAEKMCTQIVQGSGFSLYLPCPARPFANVVPATRVTEIS